MASFAILLRFSELTSPSIAFVAKSETSTAALAAIVDAPAIAAVAASEAPPVAPAIAAVAASEVPPVATAAATVAPATTVVLTAAAPSCWDLL